MLSISTGTTEPLIQQIEWQGHEVDAYAGRWIVRVDDAGIQTLAGANSSALGAAAAGDRDATISRALAKNAVDDWLKGQAPADSLKVLRSLGSANSHQLFELETPADTRVADLQAVFRRLPGFRYVEPDFVLSTAATIPNDTQFTSLYGLNNTGQTGGTPDADIDAPEAWDLTTGSSDIVVGVIDTGVDYSHVDLADNIWINPGEIPGDNLDNDGNGFIDDIHGWDFANDDNDPMDDNSHGTHVSGTIGAVGNNGDGVVGVNWDVQIMALKYLDAGGHGSTANAIDALHYATMMRRDFGINIKMTSNSWGGGGFSQALYDAIAASGDEDMLFVAAAGNGGPDFIGDNTDSVPHYPSSYDLDNIISVASVNASDLRASSSNFGIVTVDLAAPGVSVRSTVPGDNYANFSGTSMATPHVAGVAALAWSIAPNASFQTIKSAILGGVDPIPAMAGISVTGGRLNALGALEQLGMRVVSTSPARNEVITDLRQDFVINFSDNYVQGSVAASDLVINGHAANSFDFTDLDTLTFHYVVSPIEGQGLQSITLAEGAILRSGDSAPLHAYDGTFRYDVLPLTVVSTLPANGSTATLPLTSIQINFNEPYDPASVGVNDLALTQGTVIGVSLAGNSVIYQIAGLTSEGLLGLNMNAGAVTDTVGNPMVAYSGNLTLDFGIVPLPTPLVRLEPAGSQVYDPPVSGAIGFVGDVDSFTIFLTAGQVLTVVADPAGSLRPTLEVRNPANALIASTTSPAVGIEAVIQTVAAATSGLYKISLSGSAGTTGGYALEATLNAAVELEAHDGAANNTFVTAQNLNTAFTTIGSNASSASVLGRTEQPPHPPLPDESEPNNATAAANQATYNFTAQASNLFQLALGGAIGVVGDFDWYQIGALDAGDVLSISQSGAPSSRGTLVDPIFELYRGNPASPTLVVSNDDGGPGFDALIYRLTITTSDTYFVRARGLGVAGTYQLAAWLENAAAVPATGGAVTGETEANDTAVTANDVSASWRAVGHQSHTTGTISPAGDIDVYQYTFTAGDLVTIVADSTSALDARVTLLNSVGAAIASENGTSVGAGADSPVYGYRITTTGTYYVSVQSSATSTGAYSADVYLSTSSTPIVADPPQADWYAFSLAAGERATLVMKSFAGGNLDLALANGGGAVVATGAVGSTNADEMIHQFVAPAAGTYFARIQGAAGVPASDYHLMVLRGAEFDTEANNSPAAAGVDLTNVQHALGFLNHNRPAFTAPVSFTIDQALSTVTLAADIDGTPFLPQAPGSLTAHQQGSVVANLQGGTIQFPGSSVIDGVAQPGPYQPGNAPADYALQLPLGPGVTALVASRNAVLDVVSGVLPLDAAGHFDPTKLTFAFTSGTLDYSLGPLGSGTVPLVGLSFANASLAPATIEEIAGVLHVTIPIAASESLIEPNTGLQVNFQFAGQFVATLVLPPRIDPDDYYQVTLAPGEQLVATTRTPFDGPGAAQPNTLDPALELLDGADAVVATDANSAPDGKNARLVFNSPTGGTYKIHVLATSGEGEYVLSVNTPPVLDPIGNKSILEGSLLTFTAHATDADLNQITYSLGPGAPAGASINPATGQFTWTPQDNTPSPRAITVIATDNGIPQLGDSETILVTLTNVAPQIQNATLSGPAQPKEGDLITLTGTFTDAGKLDTHTALVKWGDGTTSPAAVTEANGAGSFTATRKYTAGGVFGVTYTVTDDDGDSATGTRSIIVTGAGITQVGSQKILQVVGTNNGDIISISPAAGGKLTVFTSFLAGLSRTYSAAGLSAIEVLGLNGSDWITLGNVKLPAIVDGGDGNDMIVGGNGGNVLMGGRGNDLLYAGVLRDILIGGEGADSLFASGGDDILITGYTSYDSGPPQNKLANDLALLSVLKEWNSTRNYSQRTANIVGGTGPILGPAGPQLKKGVTVFDDAQADLVNGAAGMDWYFHDSRDRVLNKKAGEKTNS